MRVGLRRALDQHGVLFTVLWPGVGGGWLPGLDRVEAIPELSDGEAGPSLRRAPPANCPDLE